MAFFHLKNRDRFEPRHKPVPSGGKIHFASRFQFHMAIADAAFLGITVIGCDLTKIRVDVASYGDAFFMAFIMLALVGLYWRDESHPNGVMSILVIPWILLLIPLMIFPMLIAAHIALPLQDARLARIDSSFGVNVPAIAAWASRHRLGRLVNHTYSLLAPLIVVAVLLPVVSGRLLEARKFLIANVVAIALGVFAFCLAPAVGPWYPHAFTPDPAQALCEHAFMVLRAPGAYAFTQTVGVICFPSFHVIWALLSASALWSFKPLRIPAAILAASIMVSTMTTGWHYFSDVIAGILVAVLSIACSRYLAHNFYNGTAARTGSQNELVRQEQPVP